MLDATIIAIFDINVYCSVLTPAALWL